MEVNDLVQNAPDLWAAIGVVVGTVILLLAGVAVSALAGTKALVYGKELWAEIKGQRTLILHAVDEATDQIPVAIAAATPWGDTPEQVSVFLTGLYYTILRERDAARSEAVPLPERETFTTPPQGVAK